MTFIFQAHFWLFHIEGLDGNWFYNHKDKIDYQARYLLSGRLSTKKICLMGFHSFGCVWVLVGSLQWTNLQRESFGLICRSGENYISFEDNFKDVTFANKNDENIDSLEHVQNIRKVPIFLWYNFFTDKSGKDIKCPHESHSKE